MHYILFLFLCVIVNAEVREIKISSQCRTDVLKYLSEVQKGTTWALKMMDSTAKIPQGMLYGHLNHFGNFDECLSVYSDDFQGKYCNARLLVKPEDETRLVLEPGKNKLFSWGVCVPSSCTPDDVKELVQTWAPPLYSVVLNVTASVTEDSCYVQQDLQLSVGTIVFLALELFLVLLIIVATALNCFWSRRTNHLRLSTVPDESRWWSIIGAWDVRETSRRLFSTTKESGTLHCLHGIRAGSMLWILLGHRYNNDINAPLTNVVEARQVFKQIITMSVVNTYVAVDSFFLLSGLLVCYTAMREIEKHKTFPLFQFYIYRYLRLTIPYLFIILYFIFIFDYTGSGPIWNEEIKIAQKNCIKNWWSAILYYQNYNNFGEQCALHTWYLSIDMQLAFLSPLILIPLYYTTKAGLQILTLLILIFCFIPFTIAYLNHMFWAFHMTIYRINFQYTVDMYFPTHTRASPYLFGILTGYLLYKFKGKSVNIPRKWVIFGWFMSTVMCLTIVFSLYIPYQQGDQYSSLASAFYNGFSHVGWAIGISWVIFACAFGYGGFVNTILSWKYWLPLSRLTYAAYLTQFFVILYDTGTFRNSIYFSHYDSIHSFFGDLPLVMLTSLFLYFTVEGPSMLILKSIFNRQTKLGTPKIKITHVK